MVRTRTLIIVLAAIAGLALVWLLVRGSGGSRKPGHSTSAPPSAALSPETPSQAGLRLLRENKPAEALPRLRQAASIDPKSAIVLNNLCVAEIQTGEIGSAIRHCEQAIALAPDLQLARNNLTWAQAERKRLSTVLEAREVEGEVTRNASGWIMIGMEWFRLGEWDRSQKCFERALWENPKNVTALNDIGAIWMEKGRPDQAVGYFERALGIEPGNQLARNNLAWARDELAKTKPQTTAPR